MRTLIRGGRVINSDSDGIRDILIEDECIVEVRPDIGVEADEVVDAAGKWVVPGGIDPHTHLEMPFGDGFNADDFDSGTRAALFGGTTTVIDHATQSRGEALLKTLETWQGRARDKSWVDYGFHMGISDASPQFLSELPQLRREGVSSLKVYTAYPGRLYLDDGDLYRVMRAAAEHEMLVCVHAENGLVIEAMRSMTRARGHRHPRWHGLTRPDIMEAEAVHRVLAIADLVMAPCYVVHVSCERALREVNRARETQSAPVFAETCPHYLFLDHGALVGDAAQAARFVVTPPLRASQDLNALWQGLADGVLDVVATDHCPFLAATQKEPAADDFTQIPTGFAGIEQRMPLVFDACLRNRKLTPQRAVEVTSTAAARIFGLYPRKGCIGEGSDADVVIMDPKKETVISVKNPATHHSRVDHLVFEGFRVHMIPQMVMLRGKTMVRDGQLQDSSPGGQYLSR